MTTFDNNQAYVVVASGAIGDTGATTMFVNNMVTTGATSVGGVANSA